MRMSMHARSEQLPASTQTLNVPTAAAGNDRRKAPERASASAFQVRLRSSSSTPMLMTAFTIAWHVATIGGLACSAASASCAMQGCLGIPDQAQPGGLSLQEQGRLKRLWRGKFGVAIITRRRPRCACLILHAPGLCCPPRNHYPVPSISRRQDSTCGGAGTAQHSTLHTAETRLTN